jgi:hypothetical protein
MVEEADTWRDDDFLNILLEIPKGSYNLIVLSSGRMILKSIAKE